MKQTNKISSIKFGFLGPQGTHSYNALKEFTLSAEKKLGFDLLEQRTIRDSISNLLSGKVDVAFIPIENLIQGPVTETLDVLRENKQEVEIVASYKYFFKNAFGVKTKTDLSFDQLDIQAIFSHAQPLEQCSEFISKNFPKAKLVAERSTMHAAKIVSESNEENIAVIASKGSLEEMGLVVLMDDVSNHENNQTRFVCVVRKKESLEMRKALEEAFPKTLGRGAYVTSIAIDPKRDRQGMLQEILEVISLQNNVNLLSIHSRPDMRGGFVFYLDLEGGIQDEKILKTISSLQDYCRRVFDSPDDLILFGSYRRQAFYEPLFSSVGIIGGNGAMGQWFIKFFKEAGLEVNSYDIKCSEKDKQRVINSDVVLFSVPMSEMKKVVDEIVPQINTGQLIVENCSIKNSSVPHIEKLAKDGVEVLGIHTMFASDVEELKDKNIVITKTKSSKAKAKAFEDLLHKFAARTVQASLSEHDMHSALTQSLTHFMLVCLADVIRKNEFDSSILEDLSTPNFRRVKTSMDRVVVQPTELLVDLQTLNNCATSLRRDYLQTVFKLCFALEAGEVEKFIEAATGKICKKVDS